MLVLSVRSSFFLQLKIRINDPSLDSYTTYTVIKVSSTRYIWLWSWESIETWCWFVIVWFYQRRVVASRVRDLQTVSDRLLGPTATTQPSSSRPYSSQFPPFVQLNTVMSQVLNNFALFSPVASFDLSWRRFNYRLRFFCQSRKSLRPSLFLHSAQ